MNETAAKIAPQSGLPDTDYFRVKDDIIFLTKGYYHPDGFVIATPVFWGMVHRQGNHSSDGERLHPSGRRYVKYVNEVNNEKLLRLLPHYKNTDIPRSFAKVPLEDIIEVFNPKEAFRTFLANEEKTIWRELAESFTNIGGVPSEDIGIFGSHLVDLSRTADGQLRKDIDFVIYGLDNFRKLRYGGLEKIRQKLGLGRISPDHIMWHTKKYGENHSPRATNFPETLKRKWPSLQIAPGILSTLRFVYKPDEIPSNPVISPAMRRISIVGAVETAENTNFIPRTFAVASSYQKSRQKFLVVTYFWAFHSPVREGDLVEITGLIHEDLYTISIDDYYGGIMILN